MRRRQGFTLVELLVAMALIVLIMAIISQAFVEGLETFRQLKGIGDLQEQLRTAVVPLREDLIAQHLTAPNGPVKLSQLGVSNNPIVVTDGFFRIEQGSASQPEGQDSDLIPSYFATNHALLFTINTGAGPSSRRTQWLSVPLQAGITIQTQLAHTYSEAPRDFQDDNLLLSSWAEVAWFLVPMEQPDSTPTNPKYVYAAGGSTQLFTLHRRIRLLVQNNTAANTSGETNIGAYPEVSCKPNPPSPPGGPLYFNRSSDVANPLRVANRGGMATDSNGVLRIDTTPLGSGVDRVLADVISFQVQYLAPANNPYSFTDVSGGVYDTATTPPANLQVRALQITIRVWDAKTEQTRQITVIQDM